MQRHRRYLKMAVALGACAVLGATASTATAAPSSSGKAPFKLVKVGTSTPAPAWGSSYHPTAPPAAVGSPNPEASSPSYFTWVAGKITVLQTPPPQTPDSTTTDQWSAYRVNGLGEVAGSAHYCCFGEAPVRWSPFGVPTVLWNLYYSDHNGSRSTSAINDSGAMVVGTWDHFDLTGELYLRDGTRRSLGTCSARDLAETATATGTCYLGDPVINDDFPAVFDGLGAPQELPVPAGVASTEDCFGEAISASGTRVLGQCTLATGTIGVMWSGPNWAITQSWSPTAFQARDVNDAGAMLGTTAPGQWVRRVSGVSTPIDWQGKGTNQRLLDGVRYDTNGMINAIVATTTAKGTSWQAARLVP